MRLSLLINLTLLTAACALKGSTRTRGRNFARRTEEVLESEGLTQEGGAIHDITDSEADLVDTGSNPGKANKKDDSTNKAATKSGDKKAVIRLVKDK